MDLRDWGRIMEVREQPSKAPSPMEVMVLGRVMDERERHNEKVSSLIVVSVLGRVIVEREVH